MEAYVNMHKIVVVVVVVVYSVLFLTKSLNKTNSLNAMKTLCCGVYDDYKRKMYKYV